MSEVVLFGVSVPEPVGSFVKTEDEVKVAATALTVGYLLGKVGILKAVAGAAAVYFGLEYLKGGGGGGSEAES